LKQPFDDGGWIGAVMKSDEKMSVDSIVMEAEARMYVEKGKI